MEHCFLFRIQWVLLFCSLELHAQAQNVGINTNGAPPNPSALLDVDNNGTLRGVLLTRLSTIDRLAIAGLGATEDGLTVYDTTTKTYWYWDGTQCIEVGAAMGSGWSLTGDALTVPGTNFSGTTDNQPLEIWTDNTARVRITTKGQIETLNTGESVFIGEGAGANDDLASNGNVFVGHFAGTQNTTGGANTAIGHNSLSVNTTSWYNTALGYASLWQNTTGSSNTAVGRSSMNNNTQGLQYRPWRWVHVSEYHWHPKHCGR
ncbi:MAG: hypothetical protein IPG92_01065 [Flavobacteriales bacterium]|nr:hypothetical protein [Flavobacteriales bacterium]